MKQEHAAVVQVFVQAALFNWVDPYRDPDITSAMGSGFFIDDQGHIVTNYHVVAQASSVHIQIPMLGKEQLECLVVGACPDRDVALIRLTDEACEKAKQKIGSIPYLTFGDSDSVVRTQELISLGYPLGQDALKSTQGIVSGRQDIFGESFIQITAALNPGSSGGPTLDDKGKVIGVNTAIVPEAQSVGYILPITDLGGVIKELYKTKLLRTPLLGCELNYATNDMLRYLKNPDPGGLYVARVYPGSLFEKAGVQEGDMLYQIDQYAIDMYGEITVTWTEDKTPITTLLNRFNIGQKIDMVIYRRGEKKNISFNFELSEPPPIRAMFPEFEDLDVHLLGGMVIMPLTLNHTMHFMEVNPFLINFRKRENQGEPRLIVTSILPDSQAQLTRTIFPGDIIEQVNGKKVRTLDDIRGAINPDDLFLRLRTETHKYIVLDMKKITEEDQQLIEA